MNVPIHQGESQERLFVNLWCFFMGRDEHKNNSILFFFANLNFLCKALATGCPEIISSNKKCLFPYNFGPLP